MSDERSTGPTFFWTDVLSARLARSPSESRRAYRATGKILASVISDEHARLVAIVRVRVEELTKDAREARVHSPRCAAACRARRDEAKHLLRVLKRSKRGP